MRFPTYRNAIFRSAIGPFLQFRQVQYSLLCNICFRFYLFIIICVVCDFVVISFLVASNPSAIFDENVPFPLIRFQVHAC